MFLPGKNKGLGGLRLVRRTVKTTPQPLSLSKVRMRKTSERNDDRPSLFTFTLYIIYKNLYLLGCTLLRRNRKYSRRLRLSVKKIRGLFLAGVYKFGVFASQLWVGFRNGVKSPFLRIGNVYREQRPIIRAKRLAGKFPAASYIQIAEAVVRLFARAIATVLNYTVPVLVGFAVVVFVNGFIGQSFGLEVEYAGKRIGYIKSEADFDAAVRDVKSRTIYGGSSYDTSVPSFQLVACVDPESDNKLLNIYNDVLSGLGFELVETPEFTSTTELANSIIMASGKEVENAFGFYIEGRLYGAVRDKYAVLDTLDDLKQNAASGKPDEKLTFDKSIALDYGLYPTSSIIEEDTVVEYITSYESVDQIYIVQPNDTPTGIAASQGIAYDVLKEINPTIEQDLKPGQEIKTAVARPFISVMSTYTMVYTEEVEYETIEVENALYARSFREVTQEGKNGLREVKAAITTVNGMETGRAELESVHLREPVPERVTVGTTIPAPTPAIVTQPEQGSSGSVQATPTPAVTAPSQSVTQTGFRWPIASGYISCYLGGYPGHTGIDIAGPVGTAIYASASGTVTVAKRTYYGYGIHLKIDHGNGFETLYAHCNDLYVSVGDYVQQGQIIATRGRTGNVSGPHLHFEVIKNKSIQNPMNYVSP